MSLDIQSILASLIPSGSDIGYHQKVWVRRPIGLQLALRMLTNGLLDLDINVDEVNIF
jgi:hypothetical protein